MNTKNLTRTAILIALLVALQAATKPLGNQFITGSCVNLVLAVAALFCGPVSASIVAIVSPFFAYLFGIAPQIWLAPAIALGNLVYVLILCALSKAVKGYAGGIVAVVVGLRQQASNLSHLRRINNRVELFQRAGQHLCRPPVLAI